MDKQLKASKTVVLDAKLAKVWQVLTESQYTKVYMFNCTVATDWQEGSSITWQGNYQGYEAFQKGTVLAWHPHSQIKYSTFDPNFGLADLPENYIHVTYDLTEVDGKVQLTITNETFDGNAERMEHIQQGWEMVIGPLKAVAEA
ncbi:MAG: SRPBCC family protein [Bacteroidota bacterium]